MHSFTIKAVAIHLLFRFDAVSTVKVTTPSKAVKQVARRRKCITQVLTHDLFPPTVRIGNSLEILAQGSGRNCESSRIRPKVPPIRLEDCSDLVVDGGIAIVKQGARARMKHDLDVPRNISNGDGIRDQLREDAANGDMVQCRRLMEKWTQILNLLGGHVDLERLPLLTHNGLDELLLHEFGQKILDPKQTTRIQLLDVGNSTRTRNVSNHSNERVW